MKKLLAIIFIIFTFSPLFQASSQQFLFRDYLPANEDWARICPGSENFLPRADDIFGQSGGCSWNPPTHQWVRTPTANFPTATAFAVMFAAKTQGVPPQILEIELKYRVVFGDGQYTETAGPFDFSVPTATTTPDFYPATNDFVLDFPDGGWAYIEFYINYPIPSLYLDNIYIFYRPPEPTPTTTPTATSTSTATTSPTPVPTTCVDGQSGWHTVWVGSAQMGDHRNPFHHDVSRDLHRLGGKHQVWLTLASNTCFVEHASTDASGNSCGGLFGNYSPTCHTATFWCQRGSAVVTSVKYFLNNAQVCTTPEPTLTPDNRTPTATFTASPTLSATFQTATALAPPPLPSGTAQSGTATSEAQLTGTAQAGSTAEANATGTSVAENGSLATLIAGNATAERSDDLTATAQAPQLPGSGDEDQFDGRIIISPDTPPSGPACFIDPIFTPTEWTCEDSFDNSTIYTFLRSLFSWLVCKIVSFFATPLFFIYDFIRMTIALGSYITCRLLSVLSKFLIFLGWLIQLITDIAGVLYLPNYTSSTLVFGICTVSDLKISIGNFLGFNGGGTVWGRTWTLLTYLITFSLIKKQVYSLATMNWHDPGGQILDIQDAVDRHNKNKTPMGFGGMTNRKDK